MKSKRFEKIKGLGIVDNFTGELLQTLTDMERVLNKVNERADKNAELYWELKNEHKWTVSKDD